MDLSVVPYGRNVKPEGANNIDAAIMDAKPEQKKTREPPVEPVVMNPKPTRKIKYRECMKNHAASIGGHANDGCGEFMPSTASGDSLACAACGCHRNFHRKELQGTGIADYHHSLHSPPPAPPPPMLFYHTGSTKKMGGFTTAVHHHHHNGGGVIGGVGSHTHQTDNGKEYDRRSETPERGDVPLGTKAKMMTKNKRFRTRFTQEQKEKMLELAEKLGWRIQKQDDVVLNQFCSEAGIKRNVLKVWMHNNKNAYRRRDQATTSLPPPPQPIDV